MRCLDNEDSDNWPRSLLNVRVEKLLDFWLEPKRLNSRKVSPSDLYYECPIAPTTDRYVKQWRNSTLVGLSD